jgi:ElaA protein
VNPSPVQVARFEQLSARTFHDIVRLRLDAFVVEQGCPYPELDGRDVLETTQHLWIEEEGTPVAYLRTYPGHDGETWVGRVVTTPRHRSRGLGTLLMHHALAEAARPVRVSAQARLAGWYAALGFERCGPDFDDDGIVHTPMRLDEEP